MLSPGSRAAFSSRRGLQAENPLQFQHRSPSHRLHEQPSPCQQPQEREKAQTPKSACVMSWDILFMGKIGGWKQLLWVFPTNPNSKLWYNSTKEDTALIASLHWWCDILFDRIFTKWLFFREVCSKKKPKCTVYISLLSLEIQAEALVSLGREITPGDALSQSKNGHFGYSQLSGRLQSADQNWICCQVGNFFLYRVSVASTAAKSFPETSNVQSSSVHSHKGLPSSSPPSPGDCSNAHNDKEEKKKHNIYAH